MDVRLGSTDDLDAIVDLAQIVDPPSNGVEVDRDYYASIRDPDTHDRIRHDKVGKTGSVSLRVAGRLHHIGVGRTHTGTHIILLIQDLHIRVVNATTGELLRDLILNPNRDYQPTGAPKGPTRK